MDHHTDSATAAPEPERTQTPPRPDSRVHRGDGRRSLAISVFCAALGGLALYLAAPPVDAWPLVVAGPALLILAVARRSLRASFGLGVVFGVVYFAPLIWWLTNLGVLAWAGLVVAQALFFGLHGLLVRTLLRTRWWVLTTAASWVAVEAVRSNVPLGGFPWGRLGFSQADAWSLPWASVGGVPLLTMLAAVVGGGLAALILVGGRRSLAGVVVAATAAVWLGGAFLPQPAASGETMTVAVVQADVPRGRNLAEQLRVQQVAQRHLEATRELAADIAAGDVAQPELVVWSENSVDTDARRDPELSALVSEAVDAVGVPILIGGFRHDDDGRSFNIGQLWAPDEGPVADQAKRQLVPFGEYIPFRPLFGWVEGLQYVARDLSPGTGDGVIDVDGHPIGDLICYEVAYDGVVRSTVQAGAQLLVLQTNNATYMIDGQRGEPLQQLAMARIRAVEHARPVVVAAKTGISAVVAADGSLTAVTEPWQAENVVREVRLGTASTWELAPWIAWGAAVITVAAAGVVVSARIRERRGSGVQ